MRELFAVITHRLIATVIEQEFFPSEVLKARARETIASKHKKEQRTEVEVEEVANGANADQGKKNHTLPSL